MEDNQNQPQTTPEQVQPAQPIPPALTTPDTPVAVPPQAPVTPAPEKKSPKTWLIIIIVLILLLAGGAAAWFALKEDTTTTGTTQQKTEEDADADQPTEETDSQLVTTKFVSALEEENTVSIEHPSGWDVKNTTDKDYFGTGMDRNYVTVGSPAGHYLHISDIDGIGGACEDNTESYTLTKKIATKTQGVYFTEYAVSGESRGLRLEYLGEANALLPGSDKHVLLTEGQSNTNTCNIGQYPIYGGYIKLLDSAETNRFGDKSLQYSEVADDEAFIEMLKSFTAVDSSRQ